jgi:Raf kinase inhibitor-like YbhB/YbcL family protein
MSFIVTSAAFKQGDPIPARFTGDGPDASPALAWTEPPAGTKALALICDDPDAPAGTWVHWVLYDLPPAARALPEGVAKARTLPDGSVQGLNDFRAIGYDGPAPPRGKPHRYFFKLYALDATTGLAPGATKRQLEAKMAGHIVAEAALMGTYRR